MILGRLGAGMEWNRMMEDAGFYIWKFSER